MRKFVYTIISIIILNYSFSQNNNENLNPISSDCKNSINISLISGKYGPTEAPMGYGELKEIHNLNYKNKKIIEKEHNTAWYNFICNENGILDITIIPSLKNNDYDFIIYKSTDSNFCKNILSNSKMTPIRSNLSRTGMGNFEITGLNNIGKQDFTPPGIGNPYSKPLEVKKGEKYILLLDNVYENGGGHTILVGYEKPLNIKGKIQANDQNIISEGKVILKDELGNKITESKTNNNGEYEINTLINNKLNYTITALSLNHFPKILSLKKEELKSKKYNLQGFNLELPKLKVDEKYKLEEIYFMGNSDEPILKSINAMQSLLELMITHPKLKIRIEGHVNEPNTNLTEYNKTFIQELSDKRSLKIFNFLVTNKISKDRLSYIGLSNKYMLYPKPTNESEMEKNRRVEIRITSM